MSTKNIDFNEQLIIMKNPKLLEILLLDRSSGKNIKWCTDNYQNYGAHSSDNMTVKSLFYNGEYVTNEQMNEARFLKLVNK